MKRTGSLALAVVAAFTLAAATATAQHDADIGFAKAIKSQRGAAG